MYTRNKKAIIGCGGFGAEVFSYLDDFDKKHAKFFVSDHLFSGQKNTLPLSEFEPDVYEALVAIADPLAREKIVHSLPNNTSYFTLIHDSCIITSDDFEVGVGSILAPGTVVTTNVKIGNHCQINYLNSIGHDVRIRDFFTSAPGVNISGNCNIGNRVYFGSSSCIKQKLNVCDDVTIGMSSCVVKDITEPGVYVGVPSTKLK